MILSQNKLLLLALTFCNFFHFSLVWVQVGAHVLWLVYRGQRTIVNPKGPIQVSPLGGKFLSEPSHWLLAETT